jgi:hypothetical protein
MDHAVQMQIVPSIQIVQNEQAVQVDSYRLQHEHGAVCIDCAGGADCAGCVGRVVGTGGAGGICRGAFSNAFFCRSFICCCAIYNGESVFSWCSLGCTATICCRLRLNGTFLYVPMGVLGSWICSSDALIGSEIFLSEAKAEAEDAIFLLKNK